MDDSHTSGEWVYPEKEDGQIKFREVGTMLSANRRIHLLYRAWCGTALAGGTFGVLLFFWEIVLQVEIGTFFVSFTTAVLGISKLILGVAAGLTIGIIWAGSVGLFVYLFALALGVALGWRSTPRWFALCFGATTAFLCCGSFHWVPILLGQLGASLACRRTAGNEPQDEREAKGEPSRYSLKQLFRVMTVLCVGLGIFSLLPIEEGFRLQIGYCIAWQIVTVAAWLLAKKALGSNEPTALSQR